LIDDQRQATWEFNEKIMGIKGETSKEILERLTATAGYKYILKKIRKLNKN
jgi:hypothetical protein